MLFVRLPEGTVVDLENSLDLMIASYGEPMVVKYNIYIYIYGSTDDCRNQLFHDTSYDAEIDYFIGCKTKYVM